MKREIYKRALKLAIPMMIQNGITNMVSLVDNMMVGKVGTEQMTAVSIVGQLIFVFNLAIFGGISGPGIYGAQYFGQGNVKGFQNTVRMKIWISMSCLLGGILIFLLGGSQLIGLYLHGESGTIDSAITMQYGMEYLRIMLVGLPAFVISQIYASSLRETGDSLKPMIAGVVSVFVDVIFNYILIYGKLGFPVLGVKGAAYATVFARFVEMAIVVVWAHREQEKHVFLQGLYTSLKVPFSLAKQILIKGFPIFINEFMWAGALAVLTQCYSVRSLEIVAGLNISNALCNLLNVVFVALGSAVGILVGQMLGEGDYQKARKDAFHLTGFTGGISVGLMLVLLAIANIFPMFYSVTAEVRQYGTGFIVITALFFPVQGVLNALYFTLRAGGKTVITFLFDSVYSWAVTVPVAALLCFFSGLPIFAVYTIVQAADIIKVIIGYCLIQKGKWITNLVEEQADAI